MICDVLSPPTENTDLKIKFLKDGYLNIGETKRVVKSKNLMKLDGECFGLTKIKRNG